MQQMRTIRKALTFLHPLCVRTRLLAFTFSFLTKKELHVSWIWIDQLAGEPVTDCDDGAVKVTVSPESHFVRVGEMSQREQL
jgi:hypothetical protein